MMKWFDEHGWCTEDLPEECVADCSASGDVTENVEHWVDALEFEVPRQMAIDWLAEFGAWPRETDEYDTGLNDMEDRELAMKVLWLACGEQKDGQYEDDNK
jgi:hypothetical protein